MPPRSALPGIGRAARLLAAAGVLLAAGCRAPRGAPPRGEVPLRVMSYNIRSGNGDLARTAAAIRASAPDVLALQEVDVHWGARSGFADQAAALGDRLGMAVRFAHIYRLPGAGGRPPREFGVALLSRYAVTAFGNRTLTRLSTQVPDPVPAPEPGLLAATIDVRGTPVRLFNAHLDYRADPSVRARQVAELLAYVGPASAGPTLVLGDLNAPPDAPELRPLLARLRDAWPADAGPGGTYPAAAPVKRIDYVLVSPHFRVRGARVPPTDASDHRPVVAELVLLRGR